MPKFYERTDIAKEENINFASCYVYCDTYSTRIRRTDLYYLPTVILIVTLIIIGIPSPTHFLTLGLNPSFSANPPYPAFPFSYVEMPFL